MNILIDNRLDADGELYLELAWETCNVWIDLSQLKQMAAVFGYTLTPEPTE